MTPALHLGVPQYPEDADVAVFSDNMVKIDQVVGHLETDVAAKLTKPAGGIVGQVLEMSSNGMLKWGEKLPTNQVVRAVEEWLSANMPAQQTIAVDNTLSIQGAAAEAKATGDAIGAFYYQSDKAKTFMFTDDFTEGYRIKASNGKYEASQFYAATRGYIPVHTGCQIQYKMDSDAGTAIIAFYTEPAEDSIYAYVSGTGTGASHMVEGTFTVPSNGFVRLTTAITRLTPSTRYGAFIRFVNVVPDETREAIAQAKSEAIDISVDRFVTSPFVDNIKNFTFETDFVDGYRISALTGELLTASSAIGATKNFYYVSAGTVIEYNMDNAVGYAIIAFYSNPHENYFVSAISGAGTGASHLVAGTFTAPSDGYVRFSMNVARLDPSTRYGAYYNIRSGLPSTIKEAIDSNKDATVAQAVSYLGGEKTITPTIIGGIRATNGTFDDTATNYVRTGLMPYCGDTLKLIGIRAGNSYCAVAYYNAAKEYIGNVRNVISDRTVTVLDAPEGAAFFAIGSSDNTGHVEKIANISNICDSMGQSSSSGSFVQYLDRLKNLSMDLDFTAGLRMSATDGTLSANSYICTTKEFYFVRSGWTIEYKADTTVGYAILAFYEGPDEETFISSIPGDGTGTSHFITGTFTAPSDGYVRFSMSTSRIDPATRYGAYFRVKGFMPDEIQEKFDSMKYVRTRMQFGAHNGAEDYAPECTVPAYRIAGQQGWGWAWVAGIDFSLDGTMYVIHDDTVDRTTDGTGVLNQMTDEQINALNIIQTGPYYDLSDFDPSELKIPTFEQVLQQCVKYGMKMVLRLALFPDEYESEGAKAKWDGLVNLLKGYNVPQEDVSCYLGTTAAANIARSLIGPDVEISTFLGQAGTAQQFVDWFESRGITGKKAGIIHYSKVDLAAVKLMHSHGIRVYAYGTTKSTIANDLALWGVDILQNGGLYKLTE